MTRVAPRQPPPSLGVRLRRALLAGLGLLAAACSPQARTWSDVKRAVRESFPEVHQVSTERVAEWLAGPEDGWPVLLDVREEAEYRVSHLRGARRARTLDEALAVLKGEPRDRLVVAYCSVGHRSSELARELARRGFTNVHDMEGSIFEWANEGRSVVRSGAEVREVHPYDEDWGRLLDRELWAFSPREGGGEEARR